MKKYSLHLLLCSWACMMSINLAPAQSVLFDFDDAPLHSPFPITITKGGITAHFAGIGYNYSIQDNSAPVFPIGFSGRDIYPNTVYQADLVIKFDQTLKDFSILYSCQELACDDAATMRVTAYMNGAYVGTNTMVARHPGTWPVDTLACSFLSGFDSVVLHYDHRPPTCQDYGVIFLCDNMQVTALNATAVREGRNFIEQLSIPDPLVPNATLAFSLLQPAYLHIAVYDLQGRMAKAIFNGSLLHGFYEFPWDPEQTALPAGLYLLNISNEQLCVSRKVVVLKE